MRRNENGEFSVKLDKREERNDEMKMEEKGDTGRI